MLGMLITCWDDVITWIGVCIGLVFMVIARMIDEEDEQEKRK